MKNLKNMLKFICFIIIFSASMPNNIAKAATAAELPLYPITSVTYEYNTDGSYIKIITYEENVNYLTQSSYSKNASKSYIGYDSNGELAWTFYVHGTFTVNPGVSATCTSATYSYNIADSSWKLDTATASCLENQAIGDATFIKKFLFITTDTRNVRVILTCNSSGTCY